MPHVSALPIVTPFVAATALVAIRPLARHWLDDLIAVAVAAAVIALCAVLLYRSGSQPVTYWMGGWRPSHGVTIGISLSIDPLGAGLAAF